jgi:hypothetical protein
MRPLGHELVLKQTDIVTPILKALSDRGLWKPCTIYKFLSVRGTLVSSTFATTNYASAKYLGENDLGTYSEGDTDLSMAPVKAYESHNCPIAGLCAYFPA